MIRLGAALTLLAVLALATPQVAAGQTDPLVRAVQATGRVAYRGEQLVVTWLGDRTEAILVTVERDPPDLLRLDYRPVGLDRRWVILRRGAEEIRYDPTTRTGTRLARSLPSGQPDDLFTGLHLPLLKANYRIAVAPGRVLNRPTDRVELVAKAADRPGRRIDVDRETGVVLRSEQVARDGRVTQLAAFLSFDVMPQGWAKGAAVPSGVRLTRRSTAQPVTPEGAGRRFNVAAVQVSPPPGFQRIGDFLVADPGLIWQTVWSDGLSLLLVSQRPGKIPEPPRQSRMVAGRSGPVWMRQAGTRTLIHWSYGGWLITMVGEIAGESLLASADRTGVAPPPRLIDRLIAWFRDRTSSPASSH